MNANVLQGPNLYQPVIGLLVVDSPKGFKSDLTQQSNPIQYLRRCSVGGDLSAGLYIVLSQPHWSDLE